jgi:hypothetical protein
MGGFGWKGCLDPPCLAQNQGHPLALGTAISLTIYLQHCKQKTRDSVHTDTQRKAPFKELCYHCEFKFKMPCPFKMSRFIPHHYHLMWHSPPLQGCLPVGMPRVYLPALPQPQVTPHRGEVRILGCSMPSFTGGSLSLTNKQNITLTPKIPQHTHAWGRERGGKQEKSTHTHTHTEGERESQGQL